MTRFVGLLDGEPGGFGIAFPDCPGCTAMGATADEALENAAAALREWTEERIGAGLASVVPRSIEQLRADPDLRVELADGVLVSVPLLLETGRIVSADVALDVGLLADIDAAARRRGLTRFAFLASAAREKITAAG